MAVSPAHPVPTDDQMKEDDMGKAGTARVTNRFCGVPIGQKTRETLNVD